MKRSVALLLLMAAPASAHGLETVSYKPSLICTPYKGSKAVISGAQQQYADRLIAAFERDYPTTLIDPKRIENAAIAPTLFAQIVDHLACLSTQPGADPFVPEQAAALFASKRYGKAAFARLAQTKQAAFARQMRAYVSVRP